MIEVGKAKKRGDSFTPFMGCAQIYHQRWYVRPPEAPAESSCLPLADNRERYSFPTVQRTHLPFCVLCVQTKAKKRLLSAHKVYARHPLVYRQNVGAVHG
jgi:hypothetical protein